MNRFPIYLWIPLWAAVIPMSTAASLSDADVANADQLRQAMAAVGQGDSRVIQLTSDRFVIDRAADGACSYDDSSLPPVKGKITLEGNGAVLAGGPGATLPFCVEGGGSLVLRDLTIQGFDTAPLRVNSSPYKADVAVAWNGGTLRLEHVLVRGNGSTQTGSSDGSGLNRAILLNFAQVGRLELVDSVVTGNFGISSPICRNSYCVPGAGGIISGGGRMLVRDSSITENRVEFIESPDGGSSNYVGTLTIAGPTELRNATVAGNTHGIFESGGANVLIAQSTVARNGSGLYATSGSRTTMRNSIVALNDGLDCRDFQTQQLVSPAFRFEGVNLDGDGSCGMDPDVDLVATDPELDRLRPLEGKLPGLEPLPGSPVLNRADPEFCPQRDAVGRPRDTVADDDPRCALGAIERPNQAPNFAIDARLTGTWFDPGHNGHYLSVEVLPDDRVLAFWWTYDLQGDPLWLLGVGPARGGRVTMPVYQSSGPRLPELDPALRENQLWGTLTLDFEGCQGLNLIWNSEQPGYPDGEAMLERLTENLDLGC